MKTTRIVYLLPLLITALMVSCQHERSTSYGYSSNITSDERYEEPPLELQTEAYAHFADNAFLQAAENPL
ncbi:MAG: hypothetical protein AAGB22_14090, partial [Bacteroidota bacterium]